MIKRKINNLQQTNSPFKQLRLEAGLSQKQLAKEIGVSPSTIRRWEKGQNEPTMTIAKMKVFCSVVKRNFEDLPNSFLIT